MSIQPSLSFFVCSVKDCNDFAIIRKYMDHSLDLSKAQSQHAYHHQQEVQVHLHKA